MIRRRIGTLVYWAVACGLSFLVALLIKEYLRGGQWAYSNDAWLFLSFWCVSFAGLILLEVVRHVSASEHDR